MVGFSSFTFFCILFSLSPHLFCHTMLPSIHFFNRFNHFVLLFAFILFSLLFLLNLILHRVCFNSLVALSLSSSLPCEQFLLCQFFRSCHQDNTSSIKSILVRTLSL
uniref:Uncharacterized protein n=1 Tax=Cacopsylla melanoneura TaxID=428564 RepID=A0A8D8TN90_9HEMI